MKRETINQIPEPFSQFLSDLHVPGVQYFGSDLATGSIARVRCASSKENFVVEFLLPRKFG